jgi:hypothetical protein
MKRIASVMAMQARDRGTWFVIPSFALGAVFALAWCIVLIHDLLMGGINGTFAPGLATFFIFVLVGGINTLTGTFSFAVGFGTLRRDYLLGTLAVAGAVCAAWAILLTLLSFFEANVINNWGVGLHFFHLPFFSDGAPLRQFCWMSDTQCVQTDPNYVHGSLPLAQFWAYFLLLLFISLLGLLLGSIYQRFGRLGEYVFFGIAFLLLSVLLLVSTYWSWWGAIFGWLAQQTAAGLVSWLVPLIAIGALASYALLRKATV